MTSPLAVFYLTFEYIRLNSDADLLTGVLAHADALGGEVDTVQDDFHSQKGLWPPQNLHKQLCI